MYIDEELKGKIIKFIDDIDCDNISIAYCYKLDENSNVWNFKKHQHNFIELIYFIEGNARIQTSDKTSTVSLYDVIVYPANVYHEESLQKNTHQNVICIAIDEKNKTYPQLKSAFEFSDINDNFGWCIIKLFEEYERKEHGDAQLINSLLKTMFLFMKQTVSRPASHNNEIINKCIKYITQNYEKKILTQELADINYISSSYLSRLMQQELGRTPNELKSTIRIEHAKHLLKYSAYSIEDITYMCGFNDAKYFGKKFKHIVGITPHRYKSEVTDKGSIY